MTKQNKKLIAGVLLTVFLIVVARVLRLMINGMDSLILPTLLLYLRGVIHLSLALVWTVSVYQRITNKQARAFVLSVALGDTVLCFAPITAGRVFWEDDRAPYVAGQNIQIDGCRRMI